MHKPSSCQVSEVEDWTNAGMRDFLRSIPEEEVHGLLKTTTAGLIQAQSVEDAIRSIILYSDAVTLLNRRRVNKELLINYMISKNVRFPETTSKTYVCRAVLSFWGHDNFQALKFNDILTPKESKPQHNTPIQSPSSKKTVPSKSKTAVQKSITISEPKSSQDNANQQVVASINSSSLERAEYEEETIGYEDSISLRHNERQVGQQFGEEFAKWFYGSLNGVTEFRSSHFWPQCNMRIEHITHNSIETTNIKEIYYDGQKCYDEILRSTNGRQIFLNPNLIPGVGVRGKINPHGLALVVVCGTFLQQGNAIGVFEQVFGLMMDPAAENNYKVKFSLLKFRHGSQMIKGNNPPALCDTSLVEFIEGVDD